MAKTQGLKGNSDAGLLADMALANAAFDAAHDAAWLKLLAAADKDNAALDAKDQARADKARAKMLADADADNAAFDKAIADAALLDDLADKFDALADAAGGMVLGNICNATRAVARWFRKNGHDRKTFIACGVANGCNARNLAIEWHYGVNTSAYAVIDITD